MSLPAARPPQAAGAARRARRSGARFRLSIPRAPPRVVQQTQSRLPSVVDAGSRRSGARSRRPQSVDHAPTVPARRRNQLMRESRRARVVV